MSVHKPVEYLKQILRMDFTVKNVGTSIPYLECELGFFCPEGLQVL